MKFSASLEQKGLNLKEAKKLLEEAIAKLIAEDSWLLSQDLSEQSISHKLAEHLQKMLPDFNVDCEYNGNIEQGNGRKSINILKEQLNNLGLLRDRKRDDIEKEFTTRAVFPDIIIHRRGTNENNYIIVEIKKSTSTVPHDYDHLNFSIILQTKLGMI